MSNLLLNEHPLVILPELAVKVGLNEAIILQQMNYWINKKINKREGRYWVYQTYEEWKKQFPFWSVSTIKRSITSLEKQGFIIKDNFNKAGFDKTVWYSIDFEALKGVNHRLGHNDPTRVSKWNDGEGHNEPTNTLDSSKTPTKTSKDIKNAPPSKKVKHKHGEFDNVLLTDEELERLRKRFPDDLETRIEKLSGYVASKGTSYKSHYATIINWHNRAKKEAEMKNNKPKHINAYSEEEINSLPF